MTVQRDRAGVLAVSLAALLAMLPSAVRTQDVTTLKRDMVGQWELSTT
ncbi:MAG: hypothetical protein FWD68_21575 [Alphaproteobacteria bacterium]|nr:hypothetical protein [Alphaproteobacteria bacterium]